MYLDKYQTFKSKQELNEVISEHLAEHKYDLTESARKVLSFVSQHAVKFAGVAHLKAITIANNIEVSEKTVRRALNLLCDLHIIKKVFTTRPVSGGQGANILVILPFDHALVSKREQATNTTVSMYQGSKNESEPFNSFKQNNNKDIYIQENQFDDYETKQEIYATSNGVPTEIVNELKTGLQTSEIITIWKSINRTLNKYKAAYNSYSEQIINAIRKTISVYRYKKNRVSTAFNFAGCICGLVKKNIKCYLSNRLKQIKEYMAQGVNNWLIALSSEEKQTAFLIDAAVNDIYGDMPF